MAIPSEEVFANLLDFYRIAWDYEPRSFPLQWDKDGKVSEAFTPDFYLPEFDLYVELTTMKQANVTKKNRKIRLLRAIYPHVNIQVFYQKDVQDLVMKYRLPERLAHSEETDEYAGRLSGFSSPRRRSIAGSGKWPRRSRRTMRAAN